MSVITPKRVRGAGKPSGNYFTWKKRGGRDEEGKMQIINFLITVISFLSMTKITGLQVGGQHRDYGHAFISTTALL